MMCPNGDLPRVSGTPPSAYIPSEPKPLSRQFGFEKDQTLPSHLERPEEWGPWANTKRFFSQKLEAFRNHPWVKDPIFKLPENSQNDSWYHKPLRFLKSTLGEKLSSFAATVGGLAAGGAAAVTGWLGAMNTIGIKTMGIVKATLGPFIAVAAAIESVVHGAQLIAKGASKVEATGRAILEDVIPTVAGFFAASAVVAGAVAATVFSGGIGAAAAIPILLKAGAVYAGVRYGTAQLGRFVGNRIFGTVREWSPLEAAAQRLGLVKLPVEPQLAATESVLSMADDFGSEASDASGYLGTPRAQQAGTAVPEINIASVTGFSPPPQESTPTSTPRIDAANAIGVVESQQQPQQQQQAQPSTKPNYLDALQRGLKPAESATREPGTAVRQPPPFVAEPVADPTRRQQTENKRIQHIQEQVARQQAEDREQAEAAMLAYKSAAEASLAAKEEAAAQARIQREAIPRSVPFEESSAAPRSRKSATVQAPRLSPEELDKLRHRVSEQLEYVQTAVRDGVLSKKLQVPTIPSGVSIDNLNQEGLKEIQRLLTPLEEQARLHRELRKRKEELELRRKKALLDVMAPEEEQQLMQAHEAFLRTSIDHEEKNVHMQMEQEAARGRNDATSAAVTPDEPFRALVLKRVKIHKKYEQILTTITEGVNLLQKVAFGKYGEFVKSTVPTNASEVGDKPNLDDIHEKIIKEVITGLSNERKEIKAKISDLLRELSELRSEKLTETQVTEQLAEQLAEVDKKFIGIIKSALSTPTSVLSASESDELHKRYYETVRSRYLAQFPIPITVTAS